MSDFVDLFAEGLIRMAVVVSFPLIIRTKSLSWGTGTEQLFSSVVRNIAFLTKKRESEGEKERERLLSVSEHSMETRLCQTLWCISVVTRGPDLSFCGLRSPEGAVVGLGLG